MISSGVNGLPVSEVDCYSGYMTEQRPKSFTISSRRENVRNILREWREPGKRCFRVVTESGRSYLLEHYPENDLWIASVLRRRSP